MEHPLIGDLGELTLEQLHEKINELHRKLGVAARSGNGYLCDQLRMAIESYTNRARQIQDKQYQEAQKNFDDKINISNP
jgi:hypothetical protein